mmetsp:Transcript_86377/g.249502  ORF Transcript_86377/g.249502 Transcript_86377/m.249502 type:complete len:366 (+) Transcript_86377:93-1190(+)
MSAEPNSPWRLIAAGVLAFEQRASAMGVMRTLLLTTLVIIFSVVLIATNRAIMLQSEFSYPAVLVLLDQGLSCFISIILRLLVPSWFPCLTNPDKDGRVTWQIMCRQVLPIVLCFVASLVTSNMVYRYLSIAFMQMLKQTSIVFIYLLSVIFGTERFGWARMETCILAAIFGVLSAKGEVHMNAIGFGIQMLAIVFESLRVSLLGVLLSGSQLDPFTTVLIMSSSAVVVLSLIIGGAALLPATILPHFLAMPTAAEMQDTWQICLFSCVMAFLLQLSVLALIKHSATMTYVFARLIKDVIAVIMGAALLRDHISPLQWVSFQLQIVTVFMWSLIRLYPYAFRGRSLFGGLVTLMTSKDPDAEHVA